MTKFLCLDTATEVCSVALIVNGEIIDFKEDLNGQSHSKLLTVFIDDILKSNRLKVADLDAIAISSGPGSYTGLRIGVSAAKGLCYAANKPLISISSLHAMADFVTENQEKLGITIQANDQLLPMIDARRMEVYGLLCNADANIIEEVKALVIDENSLNDNHAHQIYYFGNGAAKCQDTIQNEQAIFVDKIYTSASNMKNLVIQKFNKKEFEDVAYYEPFYLKEFVALKAKNSVLNR